jgi:putative alpha-1,2-mannosidase
MMKSDFSRRSLIKGMATAALVPAHLPMEAAPGPRHEKDPVDYVDLNMGGIGQLLSSTIPRVQLPFGMMSIAPVTTPGINDRYLADKIFGFPAGGIYGEPAGGLTMMPMIGSAETDPAIYASRYDHDLETATPYYYAATLENYNIETEITISEHAAYYRLTIPKGAAAHVLFSAPQTVEIDLPSATSMTGHGGGGRGGRGVYIYAEFSKPVASSQTLKGLQLPSGRQQAGGSGHGIMADFSPDQENQIGIRIGLSNFSLDQAHKNLQNEIPEWDFDRARAQARATWNQVLSKMAVKGGSEEQRTVFYTCLYRVLTHFQPD